MLNGYFVRRQGVKSVGNGAFLTGALLQEIVGICSFLQFFAVGLGSKFVFSLTTTIIVRGVESSIEMNGFAWILPTLIIAQNSRHLIHIF